MSQTDLPDVQPDDTDLPHTVWDDEDEAREELVEHEPPQD